MEWLKSLCRGIDSFTEVTGRAVTWLTVILIVNTCAVVVWRYLLGGGSIALQESMSYIHATLFMLGIAYTLKRGGHVRVDVFHRNFRPRTRAVVDMLGTLFFLIPVSVLIFAMSWDYVASSWAVRETSSEGAGLKIVYLLKTLMLVLPATLILQGVAEFLKNLLFFLGRDGEPVSDQLETI